MLPLLTVLLPFAAAPLVAWVARFNRFASAWAAGATTLLSLVLFIPAALRDQPGSAIVSSQAWLPQIGLDLAFRVDGLSILFTGLILIIGLLIILYARYYLSAKDSMGRFFAYMMLFMGSMLGIVLSENLIQLVVFWELTSLSSFLLISYWQHRREARFGARMALAITGAGGLAMLGGVLLLGHVVGSYNLTEVLLSGDQIRHSPLYLPILILILLGVFTKSAQFPFHFWLPNAMAAPTPVSAYLHSATMVKAGIFLLARLFPALSGTIEWQVLVGGAGLLTFLLGAYTALFKHDLKGLLAYSTISHLGLITLLFGFGTPLAAVAGVFHIINHATFKASLFMVAGIVDHETGTRDMRRLGGLARKMPHTTALAIIAASAMAGVPLLNGFLSKEMFFAESVDMAHGMHPTWLLPMLVTIGGVLSVAYSVRFIHDTFFGRLDSDLPKEPHEPHRFMKIPVDLLVVLCLAVGILPAVIVGPLLTFASEAVLQGPTPHFSLALWHGVHAPLIMSMIALSGGVFVYLIRGPLTRFHERAPGRIDARLFYRIVMQTLFSGASGVTRWFDRGQLAPIVGWTTVFALLAGFIGFAQFAGPNGWHLFGDRAGMPMDTVTAVGIGMILLATLATVLLHTRRLIALIPLGVVGLGVALLFARFSAPDLALTQLSVEVVTIILMLLALYYLPQISEVVESTGRRWRDGIIAVLAGTAATILTYAVMTRNYDSIAEYFLKESLPLGGGHNVVNVILVDFRGYDTFGEITVLALAALGIFAMLQNLRLPASRTDLSGRAWVQNAHPLLLRSLTQVLLPMTLVVGLYILLRGHNAPGGGFIAGLIVASALVAQYLAHGINTTANRMKVSMHASMALGLLLAAATGIGAILIGYPYLTSTFGHLHWPIVGSFELASAMAFDLGVFLVVVGATVLILVQLGRLTENALPRPGYHAVNADNPTEEEA